jgi:hypothetical protein
MLILQEKCIHPSKSMILSVEDNIKKFNVISLRSSPKYLQEIIKKHED